MSIGLALVLQAALAQGPRDTLTYSVALVAAGPHVSIEARLTNLRGGPVTLVAPPAAPRARTEISALAATDERGNALTVRSVGSAFVLEPAAPGAIRFRYRVEFRDRIAEGSTGAGFDASHMYAVTSALFVAPDPTVQRKSDVPYPVLRVGVIPPAGWEVVTGFPRASTAPGPAVLFTPSDGEELIGATIAAAPDFRIVRDTAAGTPFTVAIRGRRYFTDSLLIEVVRGSLRGGVAAFGPVPVPSVTYTSDLGRIGRTSGSLHGGGSIGLVWEPGEVLERSRSHDTFHETIHLWFGGAMTSERWWNEGVTDYFAARLLASWNGNAGDLAALVYESYYNYLAIPHNTRLTMAQEARRGMAGDNTELLAYRKGMLAGLLLDAAIRRGSDGRATLDTIARRMLALAQSRRSHVVREAEIRDAVRDVAGGRAAQVWDQVVAGTELIQLTAVTAALEEITGRSFEPPERPKGRKVLHDNFAR